MSSLEVRTGQIYEAYGLDAVGFNLQQFKSEWGDKLELAGFDRISQDIMLEAGQREFLATELSDEQMVHVNAIETLRSARDAEIFQQSVATTLIDESFEKLVDLRGLPEAAAEKWTFTDGKYHEACGEWAGRDKLFLVRETVAKKLSQLAALLDRLDTGIHFEDGFRPLGVQEGLFARRIGMARASHPEWSDDELLLEARSKTAYTPRFAAHKAGAAVDVRLYDAQSKDFYDIGHDYPDGGEIVRLNTEFVTQSQWQNRKILEHVSKAVGLLMYPYEDWHLCYGDATAAVVGTNEPPYKAIYGPVKRFDTSNGVMLEGYSADELDRVFSFVSEVDND